MNILGVEPGRTVADIGAGSGWFTVRAAKRVTNTGEVYAVDINPEAIDYINNRVHKEQLNNVKTILSKPDNPELPADSIDAVLFLKAYHEVADPVVLMRNLRVSLKPGRSGGNYRARRKWRGPWHREAGGSARGRRGRIPAAGRA